MNTDELIEHIHQANAARRRTEHHVPRRIVWRIAIPAAVAAILLIVLLPRKQEATAPSNMPVQATATTGIYCNSQCNPDEVLALIDNNINHIRSIQAL